jgi:hypothetical protein
MVSTETVNQDKPYMAIDNTGGQRDGRVYVAWTDFADGNSSIRFRYTSDQGSTWSDIVTIDGLQVSIDFESVSCAPTAQPGPEPDDSFVQGAVPAVAPNGDVYVVWMVVNQDGATGSLKIRRSTNGGDSFESPHNVTDLSAVAFWGLNVGKLRVMSIPCVAIDPNNGHIFVAYNQMENNYSDANVYIAYSTNSGVNWSTPYVATERSSGWQFYPWLTVAPSGTISLVYYEGTSSAVNVYVAQSYNGGTSFHTPNSTLTSSSFAPSNGYFSDYIGIASSSTSDVFAAWTDWRNGNSDIYGAMNGTPAQPQNLSYSVVSHHPVLHWNANTESDLYGYDIYRDYGTGGGFENIASVSPSTTSFTDNDTYVYNPNRYSPWASYYLVAVDNSSLQSLNSNTVSVRYDGLGKKAGIAAEAQKPNQFALDQNYPNPFNPTTTLAFDLPEPSQITLAVYDYIGSEVATVVNGYRSAGHFEVTFDASKLGSGVYFYKLQAGAHIAVKKLMVIK